MATKTKANFSSIDIRDVNSIYFRGVTEDCPAKILYVILFFLVTVVDQMVLGPVRCTAAVHYTVIFAMRNGKFSELGGG